MYSETALVLCTQRNCAETDREHCSTLVFPELTILLEYTASALNPHCTMGFGPLCFIPHVLILKGSHRLFYGPIKNTLCLSELFLYSYVACQIIFMVCGLLSVSYLTLVFCHSSMCGINVPFRGLSHLGIIQIFAMLWF